MLGLLLISTLTQAPLKLNIHDYPKELAHARRDKAYAAQLAEATAKWFGKAIDAGSNPKVDGLSAVIAVRSTSEPTLISEDTNDKIKLQRIGDSDIYVAAPTFKTDNAYKYHFNASGKDFGGGILESYDYPPEDKVQPGVPQGKLTRMPDFHSQTFPGTTREWYVYVPAELGPDEAANVMVFQDGQGMKNYVPVVFDNLIAKGQMPKTVGIFIAPGTFADGKSDRSFEYDTLSDQYANFLIEEILPEVGKTVKLKQDAASRAICGLSSGGICAFTVAWQRPDQFSKVLSWIGSFTDIAHGPSLVAGGHNYPFLIRLSEPKPIRVYLQDGRNDLDNTFGSWPLANEQMARALAFKKYDYKFDLGYGTHSDAYGRKLLPDALRWLWRINLSAK